MDHDNNNLVRSKQQNTLSLQTLVMAESKCYVE